MRTSISQCAAWRILLVILSGASVANAQQQPTVLTPTWPPLADRGWVAGRTFDVADIENIGIESGNLVLNIPLTSLPPGPGGSSYSVGLVYNSQVFDQTLGTSISANSGAVTKPTLLVPSSHGGGWNFSWQYSLVSDVKALPDGANACFGDNLKQYRVSIVYPDGSQHLLHTLGYQMDADGYSMASWLGSVITGCGVWQTLPPESKLIYYTDDGTYARLELSVGSQAWVLYRSDGSRVVGSGVGNSKVSDVIDRNGNAIHFEHKIAEEDPLVTISDSLGRFITISFALGSTNPTDYVTGPGANGAYLTWTINGAAAPAPATPGGQPPQMVYKCVSSQEFPFCTGPTLGGQIESIELPSTDGTDLRYKFTYDGLKNDTGLGQMKSVQMPFGQITTYQYQYQRGNADAAGVSSVSGPLRNPVVSKTTTYKDSQGADRSQSWTYGQWGSGVAPEKKVTYPDGGVRTYVDDGGAFQTHRVAAIVEPNGDRTDRVWRNNCPFQIFSQQPGNPYVKAEYRTVAASTSADSKTTLQTYTYDRNGNQLGSAVYDWGTLTVAAGAFPSGEIPNGAVLLRSTANVYAVTPGYSLDGTKDAGCGTDAINNVNAAAAYWNSQTTGERTISKLDTVLSTEISVGGVVKSRIERQYDDSQTTANLTSERRWDSQMAPMTNPLSAANSILTSYSYDAYGNMTATTDPNGITTTYDMGFCKAEYTDHKAYAKSITRAGLTTSMTWDCSSGLMATVTDPNGVETKRTHDDLGRPTLVQEALGSERERQTKIDYVLSSTSDNATFPLITTISRDLNTKGDFAAVSVEKTDQLGKTAVTIGPDGSTIEQVTPLVVGGDSGATYEVASNPYVATSDPTMGWTRTTRDRQGRVVEVAHFSGAGLPAPWGTNTALAGSTSTAYDGASTLVSETGQDGRVHTRKQTMDGAGRLVGVVEDVGNTTNYLNYVTSYSYDVQDNLTGVTQGNQTRTFGQSSLSRLYSASNPESGTISYRYDPNGNLLTRTDGRSTVKFGFDDLNRLVAKQYNDNGTTPDVTICYDGDTGAHSVSRGNPSVTIAWSCAGAPTGTFSKLQRTMVKNNVSTTRFLKFDELGRVSSSEQVTNGVTYSISDYQYNLAGGLKSITYPSGRTVSYGRDTANRPTSVSGTTVTNTTTTYAPLLAYAPHGAVASIARGDGLTEKWLYNGRLQVSDIQVGTMSNATSAFGLQLFYCPDENDKEKCASNNGNLLKQKILALGASQSYEYDGVNRLTGVVEGTTWSQRFEYDAYGNRWLKDAAGVPISESTPRVKENFDSSTNRVSINQSHFDSAGNLDKMGGYGFAYDAENRMASETLSGATTSYAYDGDGRRVLKTLSDSTKIAYVYDAAGQMIAEYGPPAGSDSGLRYLSVDMLGSTRMITNAAGVVKARRDYLPFGEEIASGVGARGTEYGAESSTAQRFTGKERDTETGLDYFGARYMSPGQGRFTSPDPSRLSAFIDSPQSWNMYAYAHSNPFRFVDKNGRWPTSIHNQIIDAAFPNLTPGQRQILKDVSARQDSILGGGQAGGLSFQHAMRGPGQSIADAQSEYQEFVSTNEDQATKTQLNFWAAGNPGLSNDALAQFAAALHAVLDSTSPAHVGFQVWQWWNPALVWRHHWAENSITPQQLAAAVSAARSAFDATFYPKFREFDVLHLIVQPRSSVTSTITYGSIEDVRSTFRPCASGDQNCGN